MDVRIVGREIHATFTNNGKEIIAIPNLNYKTFRIMLSNRPKHILLTHPDPTYSGNTHKTSEGSIVISKSGPRELNEILPGSNITLIQNMDEMFGPLQSGFYSLMIYSEYPAFKMDSPLSFNL